MMKKTTHSALLLCLALLICVCLAACGDTATVPTTQPSENITQPTTTPHTHAFGQWQTVNNATCTEDGIQQRSCECGEVQEEVLSATGHIPGEWELYKEASATEAGERRISCLACYELLQVEVIPATGTTGLSYQVHDDGITCTITGIGTFSGSTLVIGATIDGYTVTKIGNYAFENCSNLTSVTISEGITTIASGAFSNCSGLKTIVLPETVTSIDNGAFSDCTSLIKVTLPQNLTCLEYSLFYGCTSLEAVEIPASVTHVNGYVFSGCTALADITMPDGIIQVGGGILDDTAYYRNEANWENDVLYAGKYLISTRESISGLCTIKLGTRVISTNAFQYRANITGVTIPESVLSIGDNAFYGCSQLANISISDSVVFVGTRVFGETAYFQNEANWDGGVLYVGNHLVDAKENLAGDVVIRPGTRTISSWAFSSREQITSVTIPEGVVFIGENAFWLCSGLTSLTLPDSVLFLGSNAFYNCRSLTSITLGSGITQLPATLFYSCSNLADLYYNGTMAQWEAIEKDPEWNYNAGDFTIHCTDGDITK